MRFSELIENLKQLEFQETRDDSPGRLEFVLATAQVEKLNEILTSFFGTALKLAGKNPSGEQKEMAKAFGGIMKNQTLYVTQADQTSSIAMIWPWSNGTCATVKIFQVHFHVPKLPRNYGSTLRARIFKILRIDVTLKLMTNSKPFLAVRVQSACLR